MSKHYKIIEAKYTPLTDSEEYVSSTRLVRSTPYGIMEATVYCRKEDADADNRWDGFKMADYKISTEVHRKRAEVYRERAKGVKELADNLKFSFNRGSGATGKMNRQYDYMLKRAEKERNAYRDMRDNYHAYCDVLLEQRRNYRKKMDGHLKMKEV